MGCPDWKKYRIEWLVGPGFMMILKVAKWNHKLQKSAMVQMAIQGPISEEKKREKEHQAKKEIIAFFRHEMKGRNRKE